MDQTELEQFKRILKTLLEGMERPLRRREEIAVENTPDALDQVQRAADRDLALRQIEFDSARLRNLRNALERIEEGTYGICQRCEQEISLKRLKAVPWAAYCLACQDIVDQEEMEATEEYTPAAMTKEVA
jgi:DnaK suppressor protein